MSGTLFAAAAPVLAGAPTPGPRPPPPPRARGAAPAPRLCADCSKDKPKRQD